MSVASGYVACTGCDFKGVLQYRPIRVIYHFNDGTKVKSDREIGWCRQCKAISDIESRTDPAPLQARLVELQAKAASLSHLIGRAFGKLTGGNDDVTKEIAVIQGQLRLARSQGNRARCLECGSEQTLPLAFDQRGVWRGFVHDCGGSLFLEPSDPDAPRFAFSPETIDLDQDGFRISG